MFEQSEKFVENHGRRIGDIAVYGHESNWTTRRLEREGWGKSVVDRLPSDLQRAFPAMSGFSARNIWRMRALYLARTADTAEVEHRSEKSGKIIVPQPAGQLVRGNRPPSSTVIPAQPATEIPWFPAKNKAVG